MRKELDSVSRNLELLLLQDKYMVTVFCCTFINYCVFTYRISLKTKAHVREEIGHQNLKPLQT